ncbi:MAG: Lrp/AsnC family transcriptional regulator [Candidatus Hadarchaeaceae archaeon]
MVTAFVMIKVGAGELLNWIKVVEEEVAKLPGVVETHRIFGIYDIIAKIETDTSEKLTTLIDKMRSIAGVVDTDTFMAH